MLNRFTNKTTIDSVQRNRLLYKLAYKKPGWKKLFNVIENHFFRTETAYELFKLI